MLFQYHYHNCSGIIGVLAAQRGNSDDAATTAAVEAVDAADAATAAVVAAAEARGHQLVADRDGNALTILATRFYYGDNVLPKDRD